MNPITHFLVSWSVAEGAALGKRDRAIVTLAGVAPDLDGAGAVVEILTRNSDTPHLWFSSYHHVICHNLGFGVLTILAAFALAKKRAAAALLACITFHLHLLGDIAGARGPDGSQWPIPYFLPFSREPGLLWEGQWALNAWPNILLTVILLAAAFALARRRGHSPLEMVSRRADEAFVSTLRNRFPLRDDAGRESAGGE